MPTSCILINSDLGHDVSIIEKIKGIFVGEGAIQYEIQGVYGIYDIVLKLSSDAVDILRSTIKLTKNIDLYEITKSSNYNTFKTNSKTDLKKFQKDKK